MTTSPSSALCVAVLADCTAQYRFDTLRAAAVSYGLAIEGIATTVSDVEALDGNAARLVIVSAWTYAALDGLWSAAAIRDEAVRLERLQVLKDHLTVLIRAVALRKEGRLILVQGLTLPPVLPHGRMDFRSAVNYRRVLFEINEHICELIRDDGNMLFVDVERIFANLGKERLLCNAYGTFADYNSYSAAASIAIARECLDLYWIWKGNRKIKCIVTDLDNTLWPGEISNWKGISLHGIVDARYAVLHEALKLAKDRGVILATCSKNDESYTLTEWSRQCHLARHQGCKNILEPDDFVIHKINWERKSANIAAISSALGVAMETILFLDDHPVEREEVIRALPAVTVVDSQSPVLRYRLLGDPRLEVASVTDEARSRTGMVRAQLRREEARTAAVDEHSFLRSLKIKLSVTLKRCDSHLDRIAELIQRTTQFNINQVRYDVATLRSLLNCPNTEIYTLETADRFTDYGITGVCILRDAEVASFVISCRILTLKADAPFLIAALKFGRCAGQEMYGRVVETDRNEPCRKVFFRAGFILQEDGSYLCLPGQQLAAVDQETYDLTIEEERALPAQGAALSETPQADREMPSLPSSVGTVTITPSNLGAGTGTVSTTYEDDIYKIALENASLLECIRTIYGVEPYQVAGPEWLVSQRYNIVAAEQGPDSKERSWSALRNMLPDRFKLALRRETRVTPIYELIVGKRGAKLRESEGQAGVWALNESDGRVDAKNIPLEEFAAFLSTKLDRPVLDKTSLAGSFDFELTYDPRQPVFKPVRKQLGLSLEAVERPVEFVVAEQI